MKEKRGGKWGGRARQGGIERERKREKEGDTVEEETRCERNRQGDRERNRECEKLIKTRRQG